MGFFKKNTNEKEQELINGIKFVQSQIDQNNGLINSLQRVNSDNMKRKKILQDQLEQIQRSQRQFKIEAKK